MRNVDDGREDDAMVLGWLSKLVIVLSLLGVLGLDGFAWASARVTAQDHAESAGRAAVRSYEETKSLQRAYEAALAEVVSTGDSIETETFAATPEGGITLTLHRDATTLVLHRVPPLRHLAQQSATVTTAPAP